MSTATPGPPRGRQPPLTLSVRLATFLALAQCLAWLAAGLVWLHRAETPTEAPTGLTVLPIRHPQAAGALNVVTALVVGWWQYRAVLARGRLSSPLVGVSFLLLGLLACLPVDAAPLDLALGLARASIGGVMARWAWRVWRTPRGGLESR